MKDIFGRKLIELKPGEPCTHKGCNRHTSHPCEICGRIAMEGIVEVLRENVLQEHFEKT